MSNEKQVDISVIMPCYNTEKYIREALDSVLRQGISDMEIICIDDGSVDDTLSILREYEKMDSRIQVISDDNHGQGYQRNAGLALAKGRYVYFMDSDDILKGNSLRAMFRLATSDSLDVLYFGADSFYETEALEESFPQYKTLYHRKKEYPGIYSGEELYIRFQDVGDMIVAPFLQFISREHLIEHHILFPDLPRFEDNLYTTWSMLCARRVKCIPDILYLRRVRQNSVMTVDSAMKGNVDSDINSNSKIDKKSNTESFLKSNEKSEKDIEIIFDKEREESYIATLHGLFQIFLQYEEGSPMFMAVYKQLRGVFANIHADYKSRIRVVQNKEKSADDFMTEKEKEMQLLIMVSLMLEAAGEERRGLKDKLRTAYEEKTKINQRLQQTFAEKYERGVRIDELQHALSLNNQKNSKLKSRIHEKKETNKKLREKVLEMKLEQEVLQNKLLELEAANRKLEQEKQILKNFFPCRVARFLFRLFHKANDLFH